MGRIPRNAQCPCGSGRKHKRCCQAREDEAARAARLADRLYERLLAWSRVALSEQLDAALDEACGEQRRMDESDLALFINWFHLDRELPGGGTPAQRFAERERLTPDERAITTALADATLGVHRVLAVDAGKWIELEDALRGTTVRVRSPHVSQAAVRWDVLLGRVVHEEPGHGLFGPVRVFEPQEEPELLAELERHAGPAGLPTDDGELDALFRTAGLALIRFLPPSRSVAPSFFSVEGDPAVHATAVWQVADTEAVVERIAELPDFVWTGESELGGYSFEWTADRRELAAARPELPPGALCLEASPVTFDERGFSAPDGWVGVGSFELDGDQLRFHGLSERRLDQALRLVAERLGPLAREERREVKALDPSSPAPVAEPPEPTGLAPVQRAAIERSFLEQRYRDWLDEPQHDLGGLSPRAAAATAERRGQVELLVRGIENGAERACREKDGSFDVGWMRAELGLESARRARRAA